MSTSRSTHRRSAAAAATGVAAIGLGLAFTAGTVLTGSPAQAVPPPQQACAHENMTITPPPGGGASSYVPLGPPLSLTLKRTTHVVAFLSIDGNVSSSTSAEMRAGWSVNGKTPVDFQYGPANIHEGDGPFEGASTIMDVLTLRKGSYQIQPEVRMNGAGGTSGVIGDSCAILEAQTS